MIILMNIYEKIFAKPEELHMSQIGLSRKTGVATSPINDSHNISDGAIVNPFIRNYVCTYMI